MAQAQVTDSANRASSANVAQSAGKSSAKSR